MVENIWDRNIPTGCHGSSTCAGVYHADNPYIKTTFTSVKEGSSYALTAIKDFTYDMNGNVTEVREYDYVPYSSVPRTNGRPTGLPSNASTYLKRVTKTDFWNQAPLAPTNGSTDYYDSNIYIFANPSKVLNLPKSVQVSATVGGSAVSRTEMTYDCYDRTFCSGNVAGNVTVTRQWDSTKGSVSNPLTDSNAIKTQAGYNGYGQPITTTDPNNVVTQITYGNVTVGGNSVSGPYPTQTIAAYNTSVARTSSAVYDFYTGVVTSSTDEDNDLTVLTVYDDLGRPTIVKNAYGTALESWIQTIYNDEDRYIIAKSDLETVGDGRRVATQFFDQIGRVRLAKTLENAASQSATNETDGIKVQTRYKFASGYVYQLQSNPYRATTSSSASAEETMGWTLSTSWSSGIRSEVQTFAGAGLPNAFGGSNTTSTGTVRTDIDANRTLVTDQAGKQRIRQTNGLGQLTDVWEITAQDSATVSVTFPSTSVAYGYQTSYSYDTLNNLLLVSQGVQEREFSYSSLSRLTSAENPESGTIAYSYDPNGNLRTKVDARNIKTIYDYDALNRVVERCYRVIGGSLGATTCAGAGSETPEPNTSDAEYTYGTTVPKVGKLVKVESNVSTTEFTGFDILGRVTASKQTTDGVTYGNGSTDSLMTYTYNLGGALIEQQYPSGRKVKNVLDSSGDLTLVQSSKDTNSGYWNYASSFTYNPAGAVTSMQLGNGRWESTTFNSRLQPTQIALGAIGAR
jgi:YD repeat-containing protein